MQFRLGTWNCFGMGQGAFDAITALRAPARARYRHEDVHAACAAPDVLCVQELLSHDAQSFFDGLGRAFDALFRDHNRPRLRPATLRGTGLGIASRKPLAETGVRHYRPPHVGWDRFARKGTLHTRVALDDGPTIDLVNTHLQAGYDDGAIAVRAAQLEELSSLVAEVGDEARPFIVCGDFNIDGREAARGDAEYKRLTAALEGFEDLGAKDDLTTYEPHPETNALAHAFEPGGKPQRIDYVMLRQARGGRLAHARTERILDRPLAGAAGEAREFASDHFGLCSTFEYG